MNEFKCEHEKKITNTVFTTGLKEEHWKCTKCNQKGVELTDDSDASEMVRDLQDFLNEEDDDE